MQMKASELPYDVKKKLLRQIEDQVGYSQYHEMVDRVGEDGLIDLAFQKMEEMSASEVKKERTRGQKIWLGIKIGFGVIVLVIWLAVSPDTLGQLVLWLGGLYFIIWLCSAIAKWWNENMTFPRY